MGELYNPYSRPKPGPPLTNVLHKVNPQWLYNWLKNPQGYNPRARMPNLRLEDHEISAIIAYLASIADPHFPKVTWEPYLLKSSDALTDEEWEQVDPLVSQGQRVWARSRCTICHGSKGEPGFVPLGVGVELSKLQSKVNRDWLYQWLKDPKAYFPTTLMPRFRFSEEERRALVEYLMRDESFMPEAEEEEQAFIPYREASLIAEGKRVIELSRCVLCHEVKGIDEILPVPESPPPPTTGFAQLLYDVRCLSCHSLGGVGGEYAPDLTYEGSKLKGGWIINFLQAPDMIRPLLQQMPMFGLTEAEARLAVEYIKTHFVAPDIAPHLPPGITLSETQLTAGEQLFYAKGCHSCHTIGEAKRMGGGALGPNLTEVGARLQPGYLLFHLRHPHRLAPRAVEPDFGLSKEEANALAAFLITHTKK